jgi:prephenate dehydratase
MSEFWSAEQDFKNHIDKNPDVLIGTLGPKGTSCDHTLNYLLSDENDLDRRRVLIDNFSDIYSSLINSKIDIAMIPAAYTQVTEFFWSAEFKLLGSIIYKTPDYHFTHAKGVTKPRKIATCSAVKHMLKKQFAHCTPEPYELVIGASTVAAANVVAEGKADACITNDGGLKEVDLEVIHTQKGVDMSWLFFRKKT